MDAARHKEKKETSQYTPNTPPPALSETPPQPPVEPGVKLTIDETPPPPTEDTILDSGPTQDTLMDDATPEGAEAVLVSEETKDGLNSGGKHVAEWKSILRADTPPNLRTT